MNMVKVPLLICLLFSLIGISCVHRSTSENELTDSFFALQLKHSIREKYILLGKIEDPESKRIVWCSILKETNDLISFVEQDAPNIIDDKDVMESLSKIARTEKESFSNSDLKNKYKCQST